MTNIAGEAYGSDDDDDDNEACRDGPALTARFVLIEGIVAADGVLYYTTDRFNFDFASFVMEL